MRALIWRFVRIVHHADYAWFLPFLARLPLRLAYALSALRGWINALGARDWRSVALGFRHIRRQSLLGYELLPVVASAEAKMLISVFHRSTVEIRRSRLSNKRLTVMARLSPFCSS